MFFDEIDRVFKQMSGPFFDTGDIFEDYKRSTGPIYYGYTVIIGPDGRPVVKEYGNIRSGLETADTKEPIVDAIVDEKEKVLKLVAEIPGVEKTDIKITVQSKAVNISADHGDKKYHIKVPIQHRIDEDSAKASYKNGILELVFKLVVEPKPKGKTVEVE